MAEDANASETRSFGIMMSDLLTELTAICCDGLMPADLECRGLLLCQVAGRLGMYLEDLVLSLEMPFAHSHSHGHDDGHHPHHQLSSWQLESAVGLCIRFERLLSRLNETIGRLDFAVPKRNANGMTMMMMTQQHQQHQHGDQKQEDNHYDGGEEEEMTFRPFLSVQKQFWVICERLTTILSRVAECQSSGTIALALIADPIALQTRIGVCLSRVIGAPEIHMDAMRSVADLINSTADDAATAATASSGRGGGGGIMLPPLTNASSSSTYQLCSPDQPQYHPAHRVSARLHEACACFASAQHLVDGCLTSALVNGLTGYR